MHQQYCEGSSADRFRQRGPLCEVRCGRSVAPQRSEQERRRPPRRSDRRNAPSSQRWTGPHPGRSSCLNGSAGYPEGQVAVTEAESLRHLRLHRHRRSATGARGERAPTMGSTRLGGTAWSRRSSTGVATQRRSAPRPRPHLTPRRPRPRVEGHLPGHERGEVGLHHEHGSERVSGRGTRTLPQAARGCVRVGVCPRRKPVGRRMTLADHVTGPPTWAIPPSTSSAAAAGHSQTQGGGRSRRRRRAGWAVH